MLKSMQASRAPFTSFAEIPRKLSPHLGLFCAPGRTREAWSPRRERRTRRPCECHAPDPGAGSAEKPEAEGPGHINFQKDGWCLSAMVAVIRGHIPVGSQGWRKHRTDILSSASQQGDPTCPAGLHTRAACAQWGRRGMGGHIAKSPDLCLSLGQSPHNPALALPWSSVEVGASQQSCPLRCQPAGRKWASRASGQHAQSLWLTRPAWSGRRDRPGGGCPCPLGDLTHALLCVSGKAW